MHYKIIFFSIFLTRLIHPFPLYPFPAGGTNKGIELPPHNNKDILYPRTTKELFFIHEIIKTNNMPHDIANHILQFSVSLGNKDFEEKFSYIQKWHDFSIPLTYHHFLTQKHIALMANLFEYYTFKSTKDLIYSPASRRFTHQYFLRSDKDYKLFLKLPIKLTEYLIQLPLSSQQQLTNFFTPYLCNYICAHPNPVIYVGKYLNDLKIKSIIPKKKKNLLKRIIS